MWIWHPRRGRVSMRMHEALIPVLIHAKIAADNVRGFPEPRVPTRTERDTPPVMTWHQA